MTTPAIDSWTPAAIETKLDDVREIAARVGVHANTVWNWRAGRTEPTFSQGLRLAKATGVPAIVLSAFLEGQRRRTKGLDKGKGKGEER